MKPRWLFHKLQINPWNAQRDADLELSYLNLRSAYSLRLNPVCIPCHHYDLLALVASSCCPCNVSFPGSTSHHLVLEVSSSLKHDLVDLAGCERFSHYYIEASCVSSPSFISVEDKSEIPQRHFECWAIFVQCQKGYSDCLNLNAIQFLLWHLKTSLSLDWVSPNEFPHGNAWSHQIVSKIYITPKVSVH